jgi:hypothetical protein
MKSCLDPSFKYTPSTHTNIAKTFARIRKEQREQIEAEATAKAERAAKVQLLRKVVT